MKWFTHYVFFWIHGLLWSFTIEKGKAIDPLKLRHNHNYFCDKTFRIIRHEQQQVSFIE